ncbi:calcium:proton antiporter, partial [Parvibaculum sp.]|uniref:calcium:proton antiporter n=1 Tax=Parvibaculum sp. TaxID=2024848 RepID=UPI0025EC822B
MLAVAILTSLVFLFFGSYLFQGLSNGIWLGVLFVWIFAVVLGAAVGVVRHAEALSEKLGEPYGTLVLTVSIALIEVLSITAIMMHGGENPTLVRDTLFSVVMIVMGGMVGLSLLLGALRHHEQSFNLQGANAYLGVIVPLAVFSLILPDFTKSTEGGTYSLGQMIMLGVMATGLYAIFVLIQTGRHRAYFSLSDIGGEEAHEVEETGILPHALLMLAYMVPVVFLVEQLAVPVDYVVETLHAPVAIGGVIMATLVATPEAIGGVKAALHNQLQRSVNIFLGSVLATIGLTVPAMLAVAYWAGFDLVLGLEPSDTIILVLMLAVSVITFSSGRTNLLQGAVHVLIFIAFLFLI